MISPIPLPKKNLYMNVYSSFIHNCQSLEAIKMSYNIWMDKWAIGYSNNVMLLSAKKK